MPMKKVLRHNLGLIGTRVREICKYTAVLTGQILCQEKKRWKNPFKAGQCTHRRQAIWMGVISLCVCMCVHGRGLLCSDSLPASQLNYSTRLNHLSFSHSTVLEEDTEKQYISVWTLLSAVFLLLFSKDSQKKNNSFGRQRPQADNASRWVVIRHHRLGGEKERKSERSTKKLLRGGERDRWWWRQHVYS